MDNCDQSSTPHPPMLFTGKLWPQLHAATARALLCLAINSRACCGHTAHRCDDAYTCPALPLALFSYKRETPTTLSLISGGTQTICTSHTRVTNYQAQIFDQTVVFLFIRLLFRCLTPDAVACRDHKMTQGILGRFILAESWSKKAPLSRLNVLNFVVKFTL